MIKKYDIFIKESITNKGKGPGNTDLFTNAPKKQTLNQSNQTADFLRIGKYIKTNKIDGFIDSIKNESVYIADRISGEIKRYSFKDVLKGNQKDEKSPSTIQGFEGIPTWAKKQKIYENLNDLDEDDIMYDNDYDYNEIENNLDIVDDIDIENVADDDIQDIDLRRRLFGTEDNPDGLPNKGELKEKFNIIREDLKVEEEEDEEQEFEVPMLRGTEDNPISSRKMKKNK